MPLSKNKGKRSKKKSSLLDNKDRKELVFKENGQEYAQIVKMLGNGRCLAYCFDGKKRFVISEVNLEKEYG